MRLIAINRLTALIFLIYFSSHSDYTSETYNNFALNILRHFELIMFCCSGFSLITNAPFTAQIEQN